MMLAGAVVSLTLTLLVAQGPRAAKGKSKSMTRRPAPSSVVTTEKRVQAPVRALPAPAPRRTESTPSAAAPEAAAVPEAGEVTTTTKTAKTKVYTFGAMDVEGKLKTPQLLYFLNRVKLELEMSAPDHRSFMKELERTADDPSL
jgi:hypothetical protein